MIFKIVMCVLFFSCIDREKLVDKADLTGKDYRLFQSTPAWELAKAVQDEDEKKINEIIAKSPSLVNFQEPKYGNTLLKLTVMNQQLKSFKVLLENKADVNIHNTYDGISALIEACSFKKYDTKFVELLLQYGADVNDIEVGERREENTTRDTPLIAASRADKLDLVELLIKHGANVNYQNEYKQSALSESVMQNNYEVVYFLLKSNADYNRPIFYREAQERKMYLVDFLREDFFELDTDEYSMKMEIVDFLKLKGIDYRAAPIPEYIKKKAQKEYPNSWQDYLAKY